jgi:peptidoglycan/LPS O-acetylase OafA/YrhL
VDLFFLMSGFLIMRILLSSRKRGGFSFLSYLGKRWLRIYPAFFGALLVGAAVHGGYLGDRPFRIKDFAANLLFLNGCPDLMFRMQAYLPVSWTLFYEVSFYLLMPCLFLTGEWAERKGALGKFLRPALFLAVPLFTFSYLPRFAIFYFGVLLASVTDEDLKRIAAQLSTPVVVAIYAAACSAFSLSVPRWAYFTPVFGVASSLLFVKACYDRGFLARLFSLAPLRALGNVSYSLYLIHFPCVALAMRFLSGRLSLLPTIPAYAIFMTVCLAFSLGATVILFAVCERWYFRRAKPIRAEQNLEQPQIISFTLRKAA